MANNRNDRKPIRKKEAVQRQEEWEKLTPKEQVESLDERLGENTGATKQRERLNRLIERSNKND